MAIHASLRGWCLINHGMRVRVPPWAQMKALSPRTWPADVGVGLIFLGSVGLISILMLSMVVLFSAKILV